MSERRLLIAALALMAGGLVFGGLGVVLGDRPETQQGVELPGPQGPAGGFQPRRPGFAPGERPGGGFWKIVPSPPATPPA